MRRKLSQGAQKSGGEVSGYFFDQITLEHRQKFIQNAKALAAEGAFRDGEIEIDEDEGTVRLVVRDVRAYGVPLGDYRIELIPRVCCYTTRAERLTGTPVVPLSGVYASHPHCYDGQPVVFPGEDPLSLTMRECCLSSYGYQMQGLMRHGDVLAVADLAAAFLNQTNRDYAQGQAGIFRSRSQFLEFAGVEREHCDRCGRELDPNVEDYIPCPRCQKSYCNDCKGRHKSHFCCPKCNVCSGCGEDRTKNVTAHQQSLDEVANALLQEAFRQMQQPQPREAQ